jgi:nucleoside-diphosphate-sugar epimerase
VSLVLVLGGTQYLGPPVVRQLIEGGHEVVLFHRGAHEHPDAAGAEHIHGDFAQFGQYVPQLLKRKPEVVIDLAPYIDKDGHGVRHFLGTAALAVVTTSQDVYRAFAILHGTEPAEPPQPTPLTEESETRTSTSPDLAPEVDYDNLEVEHALAGDATLPVTVLRLPVIYGPHDSQRRLAHYVRRMDDGRPAILLDERLARFRWSRGYVENVAAAVVLAATDDRARGHTYNVAECHTAPWEEWLRNVADVCGWRGEIVALPAERLPESLQFPVPPGQDLYASSERIRDELGYTEPIDLGEGLRRAVQWEREQESNEPAPDYSDEDAVLGAFRSGSWEV